MFVLGWGVAGAGLATSAAQYASFAVMYYLMVKKGILQQRHMRQIPSLAQVLPILQVRHTIGLICWSAHCLQASKMHLIPAFTTLS